MGLSMITAFRRVAIAAFVITVASAIATGDATAQITAPNDHLIVPGERVGAVSLGMTETDLLALGRPSSRYAAAIFHTDNSRTPGTYYCYDDELVCAVVDQTVSKVVYIAVGYNGDCGAYKTADGISCGVDLRTLNTSMAMGTPDYRLTRNNPFSHTNYAFGFHSPSGNITDVFFVENASTMADPTEDTIQWFAIHLPDVSGT
ncbi:MAG: hypothetical protein ACLQUZ_07645 [Rhizomicrobium sp.]